MTVMLTGLSTVVPQTVLHQDEVRDVFAVQPGLGRLAQRIVRTSFDASGIERRFTVLTELGGAPADASTVSDAVFYDQATRELKLPGTAVRNDIYAEQASRIFVEAGRAALNKQDDFDADDITHVITVSCTGFYAPGPDFVVARDLGLPADVQRFHLGFMGCYAALPALRLAAQLCEADPDAVVMVISVELCTLHLRVSNEPDTIVATSLFGDGAAAALVTARPVGSNEPGFEVERFASRVAPEGEQDMAWRIGDHGFEMVLSGAVPAILGRHVTDAVRPLFAPEDELAGALERNEAATAIPHWAIHPGGRSILDRVEKSLALEESQLAPARNTLRDFGNMSSATVLFVMRHILDSPSAASGERVVAMAFGPGLTVESALFTIRGS
jgi:predicted naringenin-chalcone synthase